MESNEVMALQNQIRENSEDLQKYLLDLECWEKEMKKKEEEFKLIRTTPDEEIPPIRNVQYRSKKKNRHKKQKDKNAANATPISENGDHTSENDAENETIEEFEEIEQTDELTENSSDHEEELEVLRKKQLAYLHKEKGNEFFKQGNYDSAINSYTTGMLLDPENPLLPANRAMSFLKKEQFQAAENDCTLCLSMDPTYIKAYMRRGIARKKLNKFSLAKADFSRALELEPENKQAQLELKQIVKECPVEDTNSIPESEVVGAQKFWPQPLGSKIVTHTGENMEIEQVSDLSSIENNCIFPDSSPIVALHVSTFRANLDQEIEIDIKEMDEENFVKVVEENMNSSKTLSEQSAEIQIADITVQLRLPPVPDTSFQFLTDWNEIVHHPDLRFKYLKQFPPEKLPIVFKHHMEPQIFSTVLETLCTSFLDHGDDAFDYMKYLTGVGRFHTMIMFLSGKEEKDLNRLLDCVKASERPESEILDILKKYRI